MATKGIDPFDLWTSFNGLVTNFQGGFFPPVTVFMPAVNNISNEIWREKAVQAENSQMIDEDLNPFLKTKNCVVVNTNSQYGTFENPKDYGYFSAARLIVHDGTTCGQEGAEVECSSKAISDEQTEIEMVERYQAGIEEITVDKISSSKWASCLSSETKMPTIQKPKITQIDNGYRVAPRKASVVVMDYYVKPTDAVFAYTIAEPNLQTGSGDQIIYDIKKSTSLQWNTTLINEFLWRLAERFGITTKDQFLTQYAGIKANQLKQ